MGLSSAAFQIWNIIIFSACHTVYSTYRRYNPVCVYFILQTSLSIVGFSCQLEKGVGIEAVRG